MAARIDRIHSERVRARIRLSQLVTRLQNNALGRHGVRMTPTQIDSAKFLIGRAMGAAPEDVNVNAQGEIHIYSHDPTKPPTGYGRKPAPSSSAA